MSPTSPGRWRAPPRPLELAADTVDVWRLRLERTPKVVDALSASLTPDERARADRFRIERDHACYVTTRAILRHMLSAYLAGLGRSVDAEAIGIDTTDHGKPQLAARHQPARPADRLHFNVSHSGSWSLLAFARGGEVGVDVEHIRPDLGKLEHVPRWFEQRELAALDSYEGDARVAAFFRCWTRKEAFIKATGRGFSAALDSFAVSLGQEEARLKWLAHGDADQWKLFSLEPADAYVGAVCMHAARPVYLRTITATVSNSPSVQLDL